jgi:RND family efflux transporter MFP subunit
MSATTSLFQFAGRLACAGVLAALFTARPIAAATAKTCVGITEPVFDVALSMPVPGIVAAQKFNEGDFVQANDVILELDQRLEQLEVERRRSVLENRKADWESTKKVFEKTSSISRDELLKKEADFKVASTEYEMAVEQLRRRKLVAPAAGVITQLSVRLGEACTALQPVVRLVDTRRCYFISDIEANLSSGLKAGEKVELEIDDAKAAIKVTGSIVFVSPVVDSASGLQKVKVVFDNTDARVRPGLAGKLYLK